jgi:hypothetical protein
VDVGMAEVNMMNVCCYSRGEGLDVGMMKVKWKNGCGDNEGEI